MKTKKVPLADVLWDAANKHLSNADFPERVRDRNGVWAPSCCAVAAAAGIVWGGVKTGSLHEVAKRSPIFQFLDALGCDTYTTALSYEVDTQGIRYMWLLLAMHVAEDEGIEIEVEA